MTGVEPERVDAGLTALGGLLAGFGGVMMATYTSLTPLIGWNSLLPLFAVALLADLGVSGGSAPPPAARPPAARPPAGRPAAGRT